MCGMSDRWQNHGEFNTLFNALLAFNDLEVAPSEGGGSL